MNPLTHVLFLIGAWTIFALLRERYADQVLTLAGVIFLALFAPIAAIWIAITALEACLLAWLLRHQPRDSDRRQYLPYVLLLNLLFVELHPMILLFSVDTLAISFSTIRIFMTCKQLLARRRQMRADELQWIWIAAYFLPALIVGPVFPGTDLQKQAESGERPDHRPVIYRFLLTGFVTVWLINPLLLQFGRNLDGLTYTLELGWTGAPLLFLILFTGFYGQSLVAEYSSRLFGRTLPYNFDRPWRAMNIKDFWARWHRSMANFVMQYIFLPLNVRGVNARLATVAAFVFMGLWHNLSTGYLIWGFGHGLMLALWPKNVSGRLGHAAEWLVTWTAVIGLSYVANYSWLA
jgi:D-alanyl-lipoteichoic acid acyltransferase DltB (MBOAT superfamily)